MRENCHISPAGELFEFVAEKKLDIMVMVGITLAEVKLGVIEGGVV